VDLVRHQVEADRIVRQEFPKSLADLDRLEQRLGRGGGHVRLVMPAGEMPPDATVASRDYVPRPARGVAAK
jgi:hypothetical protein